jgi:hypothetical protein
VFHLFDPSQALQVDLLQPAGEARERPDLGVDRRPRQVLEQVVVGMDAVERRIGGPCLVEVGEVVVDEMIQRFR